MSELVVEPSDWLAKKTLIELKLPQEGVLVLAIRRAEGAYIGAPKGDMEIGAGDTLILYGPVERIDELDQRRRGRKGEVARQKAVEEHAEEMEELELIDDEIEQQRKTRQEEEETAS